MAFTQQEQARNIPYVVVDAKKSNLAYELRELWRYRDLWWILAWRDITIRYKQAYLGAAWVILQPFMLMLVFSYFMGHLNRISSGDVPYPLFVYSGLLIWQCFVGTLTRTTNSLTQSAPMITKIYFPRLLIPLANVLPPLIDLGYAFTVFIGMMIYYHLVPTTHTLADGTHVIYRYVPSHYILWLPVFIVLALITALGVGIWLAVWNIKYRDIEHLLPVVVQVWMFASPIIYPASLVPPNVRVYYGLNPMVGVVEGFRWALLHHLGDKHPDPMMFAASTGVALFILISGIFFFKRSERQFADFI